MLFWKKKKNQESQTENKETEEIKEEEKIDATIEKGEGSSTVKESSVEKTIVAKKATAAKKPAAKSKPVAKKATAAKKPAAKSNQLLKKLHLLKNPLLRSHLHCELCEEWHMQYATRRWLFHHQTILLYDMLEWVSDKEFDSYLEDIDIICFQKTNNRT